MLLSDTMTSDFIYNHVTYSGSLGFQKFSELYLDSVKNLRRQTNHLVIFGQIPNLPRSPIDCVNAQQNFRQIVVQMEIQSNR